MRVEAAEVGELIEYVSTTGWIEPKTKVAISAKVSARVMELPFEEGDWVTKGNAKSEPPAETSVLVRLDDRDLQSRLRSALAGRAAQAAGLEVEKARIASQKATLEGLAESLKQAKRDLERKKGLYKTADISQSVYDETACQVDELEARYESSQHSLEAARLQLQVLEHNLEAADELIEQANEALTYTTITSPMDGTITVINAEVGELVMTGTMNNPGTMILEVADLEHMLMVAQVDQVDIGKVKEGQRAWVQIQAFDDRKFEGVVESIALKGSSSNQGTQYFRTEILLKPTEEKLYSGLTANVEIETKTYHEVVKVLSQAVMARPVDGLPLEMRDDNPLVDKNKTYTAVVYRYIDGKAVVTPVKIGPCDLTHTIIEEGVNADDKIIVGPYKVLEGLQHDNKVIDEREKKEEEEGEEGKRDEA